MDEPAIISRNLSPDRLVLIERMAREQGTLGGRVTIELVCEVRRLRALLSGRDDE